MKFNNVDSLPIAGIQSFTEVEAPHPTEVLLPNQLFTDRLAEARLFGALTRPAALPSVAGQILNDAKRGSDDDDGFGDEDEDLEDEFDDDYDDEDYEDDEDFDDDDDFDDDMDDLDFEDDDLDDLDDEEDIADDSANWDEF
ncbi:MAG: hypothetical protein MUC97_02855 [Bernardetiaceae bacterium]|jgi:hypothetical protein|nr:hypothetical protein [Bernardetiaceae bacterium]